MAARLTAYIVASIVGITLIAGLIVGAQRKTDGPVDLIIVNGRVFAADGESAIGEAVAVQGNKILRVGSNREIQRLRRAQTTVVDARGGSVLPGFNDAYADLVGGGLAARQLDLSAAPTPSAVADQLSRWAGTHVDDVWVLGHGWRDELFADGRPTRQALDALVPDRPAYLVADDGTTGWANTAALRRAGITRRTPNPVRGTIVRDSRSKDATGVLKGEAMALIEQQLPPTTRAERREAILDATRAAHRLGVTSVQQASATLADLDLYEELRGEGALRVRVYAAVDVAVDAPREELERLDAIRRRFPDDPLLKSGAVVLRIDEQTDPATLERVIVDLEGRGWQLMLDADSHEGTRFALGALEAAEDGAPKRNARHRFQNPGTLDADDVPRVKRLGVVASMRFDAPGSRDDAVNAADRDLNADEQDRRRLLVSRLAEAGGGLVLGSDWPSGAFDPLLVLEQLVATAEADEVAEPRALAPQPLSLSRAIEAYTRQPAWASFDEGRKGTLGEDMLADIVVLSKDVFALPPDRLSDAEVAFTIFDGKVVYEREAATTER